MGYTEDISRDLYKYMPALTRQDDFDDFWKDTKDRTGSIPLNPSRVPVPYPSDYVEVYEISYNGFDDTRINGWLLIPRLDERRSFPGLLHFHGYNGNRGIPSDFLCWTMQGIAVLSIDVRDQAGKTGNVAAYSNGSPFGPAVKGILDKEEYYYRAVYMDCLKALEFLCEQDEIDSARIILEGTSQGGGLAMAVAGLDSRPISAIVNVPSNSDLTARVRGNHGAFGKVSEYLKKYPQHTDAALTTLSYFDTMNMAQNIGCEVFASVSLKDDVCPPLCYFATYNRIISKKRIEIFPFNGHESCANRFTEMKLNYARELLGSN